MATDNYAFSDDSDWDKQWDSQSIAKLIIEGENLQQRFQMEPKSEKIFRSKLDQTLSEIRRKEQFFVNHGQRKITPRRPPKLMKLNGMSMRGRIFSQELRKPAVPLLAANFD